MEKTSLLEVLKQLTALPPAEFARQRDDLLRKAIRDSFDPDAAQIMQDQIDIQRLKRAYGTDVSLELLRDANTSIESLDRLVEKLLVHSFESTESDS
jgi:hypothetical protein